MSIAWDPLQNGSVGLAFGSPTKLKKGTPQNTTNPMKLPPVPWIRAKDPSPKEPIPETRNEGGCKIDPIRAHPPCTPPPPQAHLCPRHGPRRASSAPAPPPRWPPPRRPPPPCPRPAARCRPRRRRPRPGPGLRGAPRRKGVGWGG